MPTVTRLLRKTAMFSGEVVVFSDSSVLKRFLADKSNLTQ